MSPYALIKCQPKGLKGFPPCIRPDARRQTPDGPWNQFRGKSDEWVGTLPSNQLECMTITCFLRVCSFILRVQPLNWIERHCRQFWIDRIAYQGVCIYVYLPVLVLFQIDGEGVREGGVAVRGRSRSSSCNQSQCRIYPTYDINTFISMSWKNISD
jgi:hypothetical protein